MLKQTKVFKVNIELRHKQLRDLITISDGIIFPESRCLFKLDHQDAISLLAPLPASPHCLEAQGQLVLCGGVCRENGQITLVGESVDVFDVGCELINAVGFINDNKLGFACCNDNGLYIGDLSAGWKPTTKINAFMPINSASWSGASSGSSGSIALCGDRPGVHIYPLNSPGDRIQLDSPPGSDVGISISYSPCGELLAAAYQSGETCIWDIRNYRRPLTVVQSLRRGSRKGAFRVAKFSGPLDDLLFVSEEHGVVHMMDLRTLKEHLVLLDDQLTTLPRESLIGKRAEELIVSDSLPDTLGLACNGNEVVIGTTRGIKVAEIDKRNYFPVTEWR